MRKAFPYSLRLKDLRAWSYQCSAPRGSSRFPSTFYLSPSTFHRYGNLRIFIAVRHLFSIHFSMNKLTCLLLSLSIAFLACDNSEPSPASENPTEARAPEQDAGKLNDYLRKYEEPSQIFTVSSAKPSEVKGRKGTVISINPSDLETSGGGPVGADIKVELKELTNQRDMLSTNTQTVSNGQLLVSGGAYFINMTSGGQQVKLKEGRNLSVVFPKLTDSKMALFYGRRDSLGKINWQEAKQPFTTTQPPPQEITQTKTTTTTTTPGAIDEIVNYIENDTSVPVNKEVHEKTQKNYKMKKKVYDAMKLDSFGWINCDRFWEIENQTGLIVRFNASDSVENANVYLVFKDINSIMQEYYHFRWNKNKTVEFGGLPVGYKARLIAYTVRDEKVYAFASDLTLKKDHSVDLVFKPVSEKEFKSLIGR